VIVWAYAGIAVKESATPLVPVIALVGAATMGVLLLATIVLGRGPAVASMVGVEATGQ
jgi:hypothetical protein